MAVNIGCNNFLKPCRKLGLLSICLLVSSGSWISQAFSQQAFTSEDDMRDIFVAGGYGALFGATMGTAILPFLSGSPMSNLRVVAGGASIGFMMGSAFGLYNVSKTQTSSYFNYAPENEENYYYSMPPIIPGQGKNTPSKKEKEEQNIAKKKEIPKIGALIVGEGSDIHLGIPAFWVGEHEIGIVLASIKF
ncbi:hypothetical protein QEJ31_05345 [Pigmentibacter sp. JX0631]|uniref:hypothetical protein n=1 Tax=Pigmentibacter sp. JX0631 TaxID=2976982 RepID=UPI0024686668|nr:hypothetical protein [Pigmentibacter sp. JX0631]WGL61018.1 hypothetical protein QEJ31_05345 [Pigmentibacter sp. JX0631]